MISLTNGIITAEVSEIGAELKSLRKDGCEYIWEGDPAIWAGTAPVLFPILCKLKDDQYTLDGKTYELTKHGFVRHATFLVESKTDTSVTMLYTDNEETRNMYPFKFEFRVIFTLSNSSLKVEFKVNNLNDTEMYFSVGAHEAYATPGGIEDYDIVFPNKENLDAVLLESGLLLNETKPFGKNTEYLPLYERYFELDTLIFKNLKSRSLILKNRITDKAVEVEFPNFDYLGIWHMPGANYVCIEPWSGLPDNMDTDHNIKTKEGIVILAPHGEYRNIHTITV